jgi:hypothetical protein
MAALAQDTGRVNYGSVIPPQTWMAAANQVFYQGSLVLKKADGYAYVGVAYGTSGGQVLGVASFALDTTGVADGVQSVIVQPGIYGDFDNSGTAACAETDRGKQVYLENDNTISLTSQGSTLTVAGMLHNIADDGSSVVVQFEVIR